MDLAKRNEITDQDLEKWLLQEQGGLWALNSTKSITIGIVLALILVFIPFYAVGLMKLIVFLTMYVVVILAILGGIYWIVDRIYGVRYIARLMSRKMDSVADWTESSLSRGAQSAAIVVEQAKKLVTTKCPHCSQEISRGDIFCRHCRKKIHGKEDK